MPGPFSRTARWIPALAGLLLAACASTPDEAPADPFETANRKIYRFNEVVDTYALGPMARGYENVVPPFFRDLFNRVSGNITEPLVAANQFLQGKPRHGYEDTRRFLINTLLGLGGVIDIAASEFDLQARDEDLGQTLAVWGFGPGPYLMLPLFGPSSVRDAPSDLVRRSARTYVFTLSGAGALALPESTISALDERSRADNQLERIREQALDPYIFLREAYHQRRVYLIHDGDPPVTGIENSFDFDSSSEDSPEPPPGDFTP